MRRDVVFQGLNKPQREAVRYLKGPLLILAGAGSGKTRVLTHRLAFLLGQGIAPGNILAMTFTNKAADEMADRISRLTPKHRSLPYLGTFHSMAAKILRHELNQTDLPWSSNFLIFDQDDSERLIKEIIDEKELPKDQFSPGRIRHLISQSKQERLSPNQIALDSFWQEKIRSVYERYQRRLEVSNALDFDDLLLVLLQLFEQNYKVKKRYQQQFQHILVDEYQDTNLVQYQMVRLLAEGHQNLMVVGDDWQSIYGFRGADFRNILNFQKDYPNAKVLKLEENFRSSQNILTAAQRVIEHNRERSHKKLWTGREKGEKINLHEAISGEEEAILVVKEIQRLADYPETVVLYRTHAQSRLLEEALLSNQIPYQIIGGLRFYQRKEIKDIIAYLWLAQQDSPIHLARIINTPRRGIGAKTVEKLKEKGWDLTKVSQPQVVRFQKLLARLRKEASKHSIDRLIEWLLKELDYQQYLKDYSETEEQVISRLENIQELLAVARKYQKLSPKASLTAFLEEVSLMDFQDELKERVDRVTLMTLHNVKGLEFDNVFIVGLEEGLFPHLQSLESQRELEEERRLCYVGMTRARDCLNLSWARYRSLFGQPQAREQSSFLTEIPPELLTTPAQEEPEAKSLPPITIEIGEMVQHLQLGQGRVVSVEDEMIEIEFPKLGKKKFALEYAPIKKISK